MGIRNLISRVLRVSNPASESETEEWFRAAVQPHHHEPVTKVKRRKRKASVTPKTTTPTPTTTAPKLTKAEKKKNRRRNRRKANATAPVARRSKYYHVSCNTIDNTLRDVSA